jgi:hypothetical protein
MTRRSSKQGRPMQMSRRTVLRGLGASVALPFLPSLVAKPARAQVAAGGPPMRFVGVYAPCGMRMDTWTPSREGFDFSLSPALESLGPIRDKVMVMGNLESTAGQDEGAGGHARGTTTFLTCARPARGQVLTGQSFDQLVADSYRGQTSLPSLELGLEGGREAGTCDAGYSCTYQRTIAWSTPYTPLDKEINPRAAFDRLFGADVLLSPEERAIRRRQDRSLLDFVVGETQRLKPRLGARDKRKLDEYMTGVRELERRIEGSAESLEQCSLPARPSGATFDLDAYAQQMTDLIALGFQCDVTRVATLMIANSATGRAYTHLGLTSSHHELSHHQNIPGKLEGLLTINRWEVEVFSRLMQRLGEIEEEGPGGEPVSMLEHTIGMMGSELTDGDAHSQHDMPTLVVGSGGGALATGQHLRLPENTPMANLFFTLANGVFGIPMDRFGDDGTELLGDMLV